MSVRKHVSSFLHSVGEVMKNNRTIVIAVALSAIVAEDAPGMPGTPRNPRHYEYWHVPDRQPVPPLFHEAKLLTKSIEPQDATWSAEMQQLQSLIEQQQPHEFDLSREISTTDALPPMSRSCLVLGKRPCRASCGHKPRSKLNEVLKQAPAKFEEMAASLAATRTRPRGPT